MWKRDKLVPNRCPFKTNLRVWKRQVHLDIFSLFDNESKKSLTILRLVIFQIQFNKCEREKLRLMIFQIQFNECERDKLRLMIFHIQFNDCERDKSLDNLFLFRRVRANWIKIPQDSNDDCESIRWRKLDHNSSRFKWRLWENQEMKSWVLWIR